MDKTIYNQLTNDSLTNDYTNIQHMTINYVDDSTNIISTDDYKLLQQYINDFYKLLETYYDINKLKINADKSKILIICKQIFRQHTDTIQLTASEYTIVHTMDNIYQDIGQY